MRKGGVPIGPNFEAGDPNFGDKAPNFGEPDPNFGDPDPNFRDPDGSLCWDAKSETPSTDVTSICSSPGVQRER